ncbi:MAG: hypothetical protein OXD31_00495 [Chloroflexi bacterium]|nr:hypothetical protein [Chloroflexota bacterium]
MAKKRKKKKSQPGKRKNRKSQNKKPKVGSPNWHWERIGGYHPAYCTCAACVSKRTGGRSSRPRQDDTSGDTLAGDLLLLDVLSELDSRDDDKLETDKGSR